MNRTIVFHPIGLDPHAGIYSDPLSIMKLRIFTIVFVWYPAWCMQPAQADQDPSARVAILHGSHKSYRAAARLLESALNDSRTPCKRIELPQQRDHEGRRRVLKQLKDYKPVAIAAAGTSATTFALTKVPSIPVIFFMVPNARDATFIKMLEGYRSRVMGVTTDISPDAQLDWMIRLLPHVKKICVLVSTHTIKTVHALQRAGKNRGIEIVAIITDKERFLQSIQSAEADGCDGLLMIPDSKVYNASTVQRVLLWGLRKKKAVFAFSANIVRAGALAGQYTDPQSVVRQTVDLVHAVIEHKTVQNGPIHYPRRFKTAVNQHTAAIIQLPLDEWNNSSEIVRFGEQP